MRKLQHSTNQTT